MSFAFRKNTMRQFSKVGLACALLAVGEYFS